MCWETAYEQWLNAPALSQQEQEELRAIQKDKMEPVSYTHLLTGIFWCNCSRSRGDSSIEFRIGHCKPLGSVGSRRLAGAIDPGEVQICIAAVDLLLQDGDQGVVELVGVGMGHAARTGIIGLAHKGQHEMCIRDRDCPAPLIQLLIHSTCFMPVLLFLGPLPIFSPLCPFSAPASTTLCLSRAF